ncbi:MAG TPA: glutathione peroxidase [Devosia sp.]|nr:glutathione peroxidase [Devosia sp.]
MTTLSDFTARRLDGQPEALSTYAGKVVLVVNVASKCGFTPQYAGLETLWRTYGGRGLVILGFPCNQFGEQEPGAADEIASFCSLTYDVTFPMFEKVDVNGKAADPLYVWMKNEAPGVLGTKDVKWNFTKFLIGRDGNVRDRFAPTTEPADLASDIEKLL